MAAMCFEKNRKIHFAGLLYQATLVTAILSDIFAQNFVLKRLKKFRKEVLELVFHDYVSTYENLLESSKLKSVKECRLQCLVLEVFKARRGLSPSYIEELF